MRKQSSKTWIITSTFAGVICSFDEVVPADDSTSVFTGNSEGGMDDVEVDSGFSSDSLVGVRISFLIEKGTKEETEAVVETVGVEESISIAGIESSVSKGASTSSNLIFFSWIGVGTEDSDFLFLPLFFGFGLFITSPVNCSLSDIGG